MIDLEEDKTVTDQLADPLDVASTLQNVINETGIAVCRAKLMGSNETNECEECGSIIPEARLKIIPKANYCVSCSEMLESDSKKKTSKSYAD
jgi:phage/conjugal plasmid C-4 type zinc finger TraR family protein